MDENAATQVEEVVEDTVGNIVEDTAPDTAPDEVQDAGTWSLATRIAFRFACVYVLLYVFPFPINDVLPVSHVVTSPITDAWQSAILWTGENVLNLEIPATTNGSGDTTYDYVTVFCNVIAAAFVCLLWSIVDRERRRYPRLGEWLLVGCRYYLATVMLTYGFVKVFKAQFPFPTLETLMTPYGHSSPMRLVWTFIGFSQPYNVFAGAGEVLAGLLLFCRRTTTLGALVTIAVMSNVAMLNYSYDVPVKLFSTHLLLMAFVIAGLDLRRFLNVFILNRPAAPAVYKPHFERRKLRIAAMVVKVLFIGYFVYANASRGYKSQYQWGDLREKPQLYGIWEVESFVQDGEELPPLVTDEVRWHHLLVDRAGYVSVQQMDGTFNRYGWTLDEEEEGKAQLWKTTKFANAGFWRDGRAKVEPVKYDWTWTQPSDEELVLEGEYEGSRYTVRMKWRDPTDFLLVRRGYHWVNEVPFNS